MYIYVYMYKYLYISRGSVTSGPAKAWPLLTTQHMIDKMFMVYHHLFQIKRMLPSFFNNWRIEYVFRVLLCSIAFSSITDILNGRLWPDQFYHEQYATDIYILSGVANKFLRIDENLINCTRCHTEIKQLTLLECSV